MKICVLGLWHLGSVTAACLVSLGHEVVGLDFDPAVVEGLSRGTPPVAEPGLEALLREGLASGRLRFASATEAASEAEVLWVTCDTPVDDDDRADIGYVMERIQRTFPHLAEGTTVLVSAQMPVGSISQLEKLAAAAYPSRGLRFACSPENLRLGKALEVFLKPDRIIVGVRADADRERLGRLLGSISEKIEWMGVESAEMTKHAINAFLAVSVTFANEIAAICERVGADAKEVERGLKTEARIGPKAYLSPGAAFAGGTLARDIAFLAAAGERKGVGTPLLSSVKASNDEHKGWIRRRLRGVFPDLSGITVAVWGLTYKPGTDTLRRSMAVELCDWLIEQGAAVRVHDPAVGQLPAHWSGKVGRLDDPAAAVKEAQALVVATEWPLYREAARQMGDAWRPGLAVFDANRFLFGLTGGREVRYVAVGVPEPIS